VVLLWVRQQQTSKCGAACSSQQIAGRFINESRNRLDGLIRSCYSCSLMDDRKQFIMKRLEQVGMNLDHQFTPKDAMEVAGITYRQLNEWDKKGALGANRGKEGGWRRFSFQQLFALLICAEIRRIFGTSLQSLQWLTSYLLRPGSEQFIRAAYTIAEGGWTMYLLTDFRETCVMHGDISFEGLIEEGFFRSDTNTGFAFLHINPLVNRILVAAGQPPLKKSDAIYELWANTMSSYEFPSEVMTESERNLLQLIRNKPNQEVTVLVNDGQIQRAYVDEHLKKPEGGYTRKQMLAALESQDFSTLTVGKRDGEIARMTLRTPIRIDGDTGRTRSLSAGDDE